MSNCVMITLNHALIELQIKTKVEKNSKADLARAHDTEFDVSILDKADDFSSC